MSNKYMNFEKDELYIERLNLDGSVEISIEGSGSYYSSGNSINIEASDLPELVKFLVAVVAKNKKDGYGS